MPRPPANTYAFSRWKRQDGVSAIEFTLVFPALFGLFWIIISYSFPFLMLQTFNAAAAEGARTAIGVVLEPTDTYEERVIAAVEQSSREGVDLLGSFISDRVNVTATIESGVVNVRVIYPNYTANPVIPVIRLPYFGEIPRLPEDLVSQGSVRL